MLKQKNMMAYLEQEKIIAIIRGVSPASIMQTAEALYEGGIRFAEVTFCPDDRENNQETLRSIEMLRSRMPGDFEVGAGTVLYPEQVMEAKKAGAGYIISPNVSADVIWKTKEEGLLSIPGIFTPSEAQKAVEYGADLVKMFPAGVPGSDYIKAIKSSMNHLRIFAVGGVSIENVTEFLRKGADGIGVGSELVSPALIKQSNYQEVCKRARRLVTAVNDIFNESYSD